METEFPISHKYGAWEIRVCVVISLTFQIFLIFLAPLRKNRATRLIRFVIWSSYLLAYWIAAFALGLLLESNSPDNESPEASSTSISLATNIGASTAPKHGPANNTDSATTAIQGSWAPFLLLHLGGPDSITAFTLEDNELWLRHFLGFAFLLFASIWVLFVSLRLRDLIPIGVIMLLVGVLKCTERTFCLYRGSMDGFRDSMLGTPDPGPNYAKLMEEYDSKKKAGMQTEIFIGEPSATADTHEKTAEELKSKSKRASAYHFYETFRCLFVDLIPRFDELAISYNYFVNLTASNAFKVIEIELNFVYDVLYTKAAVIHTRLGYAFRLLCSAGILSAFLVFFFINKNDFSRLDIAITYALLIGAMALDTTTLTMLLFSDWTRVFLEDYLPQEHPKHLDAVLKWCSTFHKRWSEKISQMNLISRCISEPLEKTDQLCNFNSVGQLFSLKPLLCLAKLTDKLCFNKMLTELLYVHSKPVDDKLKEFIFQGLKNKPKEKQDYKLIKKIGELRGARALNLIKNDVPDLHRDIMKTVRGDFDESLLLWHIATELCYNVPRKIREDNNQTPRQDEEEQRAGGQEEETQEGIQGGGEETHLDLPDLKDISKRLSNYMLYLLVLQPTVLSTTDRIGLIRYRDTCAEARRFFEMGGRNPNQKDACQMLIEANTEAKPAAVKGDRSKSVLFDACILAKDLSKLKDETVMWRVIAGVWRELLAYAGWHCRGMAHARLLSRGGEFITMVWFLMAHLGLGDLHQIQADHARIKIIVDN